MRAPILSSARARMGDLRAVLAIPAFRDYQIGNQAHTVGFWMQRIAVGWTTWQLTGSEAWLGAVAFAELFPSIFTALWGGRLADRHPSMAVLMWVEIATAGVSLALAALWALGVLTPWLIVLLMAALGALSGLALPARLSMASWLAPPALLPSALAINSTGFNLARFLGPAVAAAMIAAGWLGAVYLVTTLTTLAFALALWRLRAVPRQSPARAPLPPATTWEVFRAVALTPVVAGVIALQFAQGLLIRPASELFPAFAEEVFARGAQGLGALNASLGVGAIIGALVLSGARAPRAALRQIFTHSLIFAVSLLVFVATQTYGLALAILVLHGMAMSASNIAALAFVQLNTPQERLGRVLSLYTIVFRVSPALGALAFGLLAEAAGLMASGILLGGLGLIMTIALGAYVSRPGALERVMQ